MSFPTNMQTQEHITFALSRHVPDMRQRGVRIETSYGELELDANDSEIVAALVKVLLEQKLAQIKLSLTTKTKGVDS